MKLKDSLSRKYEKPSIISHYMGAIEKYFNVKPYIPVSIQGKFKVLQDDLRQDNFDPQDYAYTIVSSLYKWTKSKKLSYLPVNVFCGNWAYDKYKKIKQFSSVKLDDDDKDSLIHSELLIARTFIEYNLSGKSIRFSQVVREFEALVSKDWIELYDNDDRLDIMSDAIELLCSEYGLRHASSYTDIIDRVLCKRKRINSSDHSG